MIYKSNLPCPDMGAFRLLDPPMQNCGHDIPSDPDFDPGCGFMSHDDIAILYATLHGPHMHKRPVVEIGSRFGWSTKAIALATEGAVIAVDPIIGHGTAEHDRFRENMSAHYGSVVRVPMIAERFFRFYRTDSSRPYRYPAFIIDGNHEDIQPTNDALGALSIAAPDCITIFHDGRGLPIVNAVKVLTERGFKARFYFTPAGMFVCWRGFDGWAPPDHDRDPKIEWSGIERELYAQIPRERLS